MDIRVSNYTLFIFSFFFLMGQLSQTKSSKISKLKKQSRKAWKLVLEPLIFSVPKILQLISLSNPPGAFIDSRHQSCRNNAWQIIIINQRIWNRLQCRQMKHGNLGTSLPNQVGLSGESCKIKETLRVSSNEPFIWTKPTFSKLCVSTQT